MSYLLIIFLLNGALVRGSSYNRTGALEYASNWWDSANHNCATAYSACSPWSYWGEESCGYSSHGGDCANFVSQCLLAGDHQPLVESPCRGYPCGKEEVGAANLGACLAKNYGWVSTCGAHAAPPANLVPGDVLIYHGSSCTDTEAHATIVTDIPAPGDVRISCHSPDTSNASYTIFASDFGYYDWLHFEG